MKEREREIQTHRLAPPFYLLYQTVLEGNQNRSKARSLQFLTSYSRPFRIHDNGEIHIVPHLNESVDGVDIDFVSREYLFGVDAGH